MPAGIVGGAGKTQAGIAGATLTAAVRGAGLGAERRVALALLVGAVALENTNLTRVAVLSACPVTRPSLASKAVVATASTAGATRGLLAIALVGAALAVVTTPIRTALGVAHGLSGTLAGRTAGLTILALATDAGVATAVRAAFPAFAVRRTAQLGTVALVCRRSTTAIVRAAAGRCSRAVQPPALIGGIRANLVEAVSLTAIAILIAGLPVGGAVPRPGPALVAAPIVVGFVLVLALATMLVAPLALVVLVAPLEPISRALGRGFIGIGDGEQFTKRQGRQDSQEPASCTSSGESTGEGIETVRVQRAPPRAR